MGLYPASLLVGAVVLLMVALWAGFLLWGMRSGQFRGDEMRWRPLEEAMPPRTRKGRGKRG